MNILNQPLNYSYGPATSSSIGSGDVAFGSSMSGGAPVPSPTPSGVAFGSSATGDNPAFMQATQAGMNKLAQNKAQQIQTAYNGLSEDEKMAKMSPEEKLAYQMSKYVENLTKPVDLNDPAYKQFLQNYMANATTQDRLNGVEGGLAGANAEQNFGRATNEYDMQRKGLGLQGLGMQGNYRLGLTGEENQNSMNQYMMQQDRWMQGRQQGGGIGSAIGGVLGGVGGFVLGGPAGAGFGASLGAGLGGQVGQGLSGPMPQYSSTPYGGRNY